MYRKVFASLLVIVLIFSMLPLTAFAASISVQPTTVRPGEEITASFSGTDHTNAWIGFYKTGADDRNLTSYAYVRNTNGTYTVTAPYDIGTYNFRLFNDGGYGQRIAVSSSVTVVQFNPVFTLPKTTFAAEENMTVQYSDAPSHSQAWIGLYKSGSDDRNFIKYEYLKGTSGSYNLDLPKDAGQYEFRIFQDNGYTRVGTSQAFSVSSSATAPATPEPPATSSDGDIIFDNNNIAGVANGPTNPTTFSISQPHVITKVETYHWNNRQGSPAGSIGLQHADGTMYGPWQATARIGYLDTPNAYWFVEPNVTIKAGTYTIIDSEPSTWSHNSQSNNEGFAQVWGYATDSAPATPAPTPAPTPPATGSTSSAESHDSGTRMEWPTVSGALGYRVFRSTNPNELGISVTDFYITALPFIDVNIEPNTDYYYTVKPVLKEANPLQGIEEELGDAIATYTVRSSSNVIASGTGGQQSFIVLQIDNPRMVVNGVSAEIDPGRGTTPQIISNRTMVPIRAIVEAMGGSVGWDGSESKITLNAKGNNVEMWLNSRNLRANGISKTMDVAPVSIGGRTFVPVRFSADNLDAKADWINSTREVVIIF
ncbi:MAG: copper amine oxidase N-terminal domain-containing protein [Tindallia sp. MSAO_Bac2]|nr:MAG: copper amine oxidase N-terminal domain-containing protein [Tindallia sp. MSAO_Bac2]